MRFCVNTRFLSFLALNLALIAITQTAEAHTSGVALAAVPPLRVPRVISASYLNRMGEWPCRNIRRVGAGPSTGRADEQRYSF